MENTDTTSKKSFFKSDAKLACSMLVFYSLCTIGVIAMLLWGWDKKIKTISAQATLTADALAGQQANSTATAIARATELSQYKFIDTFDTNENSWRVSYDLTTYWQGKIHISSGVYSWDVFDTTGGFLAWAIAPVGYQTGNYDTYVNIKFEGPPGKACAGILFHVPPLGWETEGYNFYICRSGLYSANYHKAADWEEIGSDHSILINPDDWNRLEVSVKDSHFTFLINSQIVLETDNDYRSEGYVALFANVGEDGSGTKILFDNFGFQNR